MAVVEIIFIQDSENIDYVEQLFDGNIADAAIDYLAQWDFGSESENVIYDEMPRHIYEDYYTKGEYTMVKHPLYFALYRLAYC